MSKRSIISPFKVFDAVDASVDQVSDVTFIQNMDNISFTISWTGSPVGTFIIQTTDTTLGEAGGMIWTDLDVTVPVSGSWPHKLILTKRPGVFIRAKYYSISGTGNLSVTMSASQVGG